jgi:hypothetical protein
MRRSALALGIALLVASAASAQPLAPFDPADDAAKFPKMFAPYGVGSGRTAEVAPGGATLRVSPSKEKGQVGVQCSPAGLVGDFQIEVSVTIEELSIQLTKGDGAMFGLVAMVDGNGGAASISRGVAEQESKFQAVLAIPQAERTYYAVRRYPSDAREVRIGLRRVGAELAVLAADGPGGELRELTRYPFPTVPVNAVGLFAESGGAEAAMEARFHDLRVRSGQDLPAGPPAANLTEVEVHPLPPTSNGKALPMRVATLGAGLLVGLVVVTVIARLRRAARIPGKPSGPPAG